MCDPIYNNTALVISLVRNSKAGVGGKAEEGIRWVRVHSDYDARKDFQKCVPKHGG